MKIMYENFCHHCDKEVITDVPDHTCPDCGEWMQHVAFMNCRICGSKVYLSQFTNICDCGTYYNAFGQQLLPPEQWGAECYE